MPSATLCAPKCSLRCDSSASAFGVSCALKLCFMERWTATADLSFLHSSELRNVPLRHSATFCDKWTHYTFLRKVESPGGSWGGFSTPASGSSTRELNTGTGAFAPPPRPFGVPAWITRTPRFRAPFRVTHLSTLPAARRFPHGLIDLFFPDSPPLLSGQQ